MPYARQFFAEFFRSLLDMLRARLSMYPCMVTESRRPRGSAEARSGSVLGALGGVAACVSLIFSGTASAAILQDLFHDPWGIERGSVPTQLGRPWQHPPKQLPSARIPRTVAAVPRFTSLWSLTQYALAHNPQSRQAYANLQAAAAGLGVADAAYLPTLSLQSTAARSEANTTAGFSIPIQNNDSTNLTFSYILLEFGARRAARDQALAQIYLDGFDYNAALQSVALTVTKAYYALIGEEALVRAYERTVAEDRASLDAAQIKRRAGMATVADVLQAQSALAQARANLISAQAQVRSDRGVLAESCGLAPTADILVPPLQTRARPPKLGLDLRRLMRQALRDNPSVRAAAAKVLDSQATVRADRAAGMPTLSFQASGGKRFQNGLLPSENWSLGVSLRVPLFNGFQDSYRISEARALERSSQASLDNEAATIRSTVYQDVQQLQGSRTAAQAARLAVTSARASLAAVQAQYKVGLATMIDVLTAQANLTTAEQTEIQDLTTSYTDLANLADALGYIALPQKLGTGEDSEWEARP